jgi:hypothetical protein
LSSSVGPAAAGENAAAAVSSCALGRRRRHQSMMSTHTIADPPAEPMPMPALAPVERSLVPF